MVALGLLAGRWKTSVMRAGGRRCIWANVCVSLLGIVACAGSAGSGPKAGGRAVEPKETHLVHEECAVTAPGSTAEDINGDGRPDRQTHVVGGKPECSGLDFDFDGATDAWVYLDPSGQVRRRENDYDRDGHVDEISIYQRGELVEQQRSTVKKDKLDTWHFYSGGKLARTERDANGDDYVDQWWEYPEQRPVECPLIHSDVDGDGQPDPGATVDVCRDRVAGAASRPSVDLNAGISDAPTEVEAPATPPAAADTPDPSPAAPTGEAPGGKP